MEHKKMGIKSKVPRPI